MARSYKFALIRLSSAGARDERLNIGLAVFQDDRIDVHVSSRLDKVRAISAALEPAELKQLLFGMADLDQRLFKAGVRDLSKRLELLGGSGPASFSSFGEFSVSDDQAYEDRVAAIMKMMVDPEPAPRTIRAKRSRLLTQVKKALKSERVLAIKGEDLESHRVVPNLALENGLVADLALKNGAMHVIETVDASGGEEALKRAVSEIGVSALVLETARIKFGEKKTTTRLVYSASPALERVALPSLTAAEHQGAELINWASDNDRVAFLDSLADLATPVPTKRRTNQKAVMGSLI
jgi:hypothetical protein